VTDLQSDLRRIDSVTNPEAGDGGADAESLGEVLARAPRELRDRNRAVAKADFERVALDASRKLARATCLPRMDDAGERRLGWVTVVVVPRADDPRPTLSAELRRQVTSALTERAPAALVAPVDRLVVRGPSYVEVSVAASMVAAATVESVSGVEAAAADAITAFLHPLSGGPDDEGWPFGGLPCRSDLYALLEGIDGVDHVEDLTLTYRGIGTGDTVVVDEDEATPDVGPDVLTSSGTHTLTAVSAARVPTAGGS
jgi:predicted phage baseplate assembly protein